MNTQGIIVIVSVLVPVATVLFLIAKDHRNHNRTLTPNTQPVTGTKYREARAGNDFRSRG